jgi:hypothetical protein
MQKQPSQNVSDLAPRLSSKDKPTRQNAQEELRDLIAADVQRVRRCRVGQLIANTLLVCTYIYAWVREHWLSHYLLGLVGVLTMLMYLLSVLERQIARRIIALDLPQAVGPLIDVQATTRWFREGEVKTALIRLLPRLQSSDANLLLPRHRKYCWRE